jgi:hypothetical protein
MATFSTLLTEPTAPSVGRAAGASQGPIVQSSGAQIISGLGDIASTAFKAFKSQKLAEAKKLEADQTRSGQTAGIDLIEQRNQGTINESTFIAKKNQARIAVFRSYGDVGMEAFDKLFETKPEIAVQTRGDNAFEAGLSTTIPGESREDVMTRGYDIIANTSRTARLTDQLQLAIKTKTSNDITQTQYAVGIANSLTNGMGAFIPKVAALYAAAETSEDLIKLSEQVGGQIKELEVNFKAALSRGIQGAGEVATKAAYAQLEFTLGALKDITDPKEGIVGSKSSIELLAKLSAIGEIELNEAAPLIVRLRKVVGSSALGVIAQHLTLGDINSKLQGKMYEQLDTALRGQGVSGADLKEAMTIAEFLSIHSDPERVNDYATNKTVRTNALSVSIGMIRGVKLTNKSSEQDSDTFVRQAAVGLRIGTDHVITGDNRQKILEAYTDSSFLQNIKALDKINPKAAGILRRSVSRFSADSLKKGFANNDLLVYDPSSQTIVFQSIEGPSGINISMEAVGIDTSGDPGKIESDKTAATRVHMNRALDAINDNADADPILSSMSSTQRIESVVRAVSALLSRDIRAKGTSFTSDIGKKGDTQAINRIVSPTNRDLEKDKISTLFKRLQPVVQKMTATKKEDIRKRYVQKSDGSFELVQGQPDEGQGN